MISYNVPEEQWTEEAVKNLPSEDDRFEYKEIIDVDKIAKEICAFANSFGGTLFLGIEDKNGDIKGIDKTKGNKPISLWLEQMIPTKLEFRFGSFRVREIKLSATTKKKIGQDKTVISIDVFDSDLTPYQVIQTRTYYRRENSSSQPAPHSYLAYLWSRNSSDKTHVVQHWITNFLTPLISFSDSTVKNFQTLNFFGTFQNIGSESFILLQFVNWKYWQELTEQLSAKQFLRTYNKIEPLILDLSQTLKAFDNFVNAFTLNILENEKIKEIIRDKYKAYLSRQHPAPSYGDSQHPTQMLALLLGVQELSSLSNDSPQMIQITSRFIVYVLFNFQLKFATWKDESFRNFCSTIVDDLGEDEHFAEAKHMIEKLRENVILKATTLLGEVDTSREELSLRHNTLY